MNMRCKLSSLGLASLLSYCVLLGEGQTSNAPRVTELVGGSARVLNQTSRGGVLVLVHLRSAELGGERREFWPES